MNFLVVNKTVTAKLKQVENQLSSSLWWHYSKATVNHLRERL